MVSISLIFIKENNILKVWYRRWRWWSAPSPWPSSLVLTPHPPFPASNLVNIQLAHWTEHPLRGLAQVLISKSRQQIFWKHLSKFREIEFQPITTWADVLRYHIPVNAALPRSSKVWGDITSLLPYLVRQAVERSTMFFTGQRSVWWGQVSFQNLQPDTVRADSLPHLTTS